MTWCLDRIAEGDLELSDVIWTDECSIQLESHRNIAYQKQGQPIRLAGRPKHPPKIHVWGGWAITCTISTVKDCRVWTVPDSITCSHRSVSTQDSNTCLHPLRSISDPNTCPHPLSSISDPNTGLHPLRSISDPNTYPHPLH